MKSKAAKLTTITSKKIIIATLTLLVIILVLLVSRAIIPFFIFSSPPNAQLNEIDLGDETLKVYYKYSDLDRNNRLASGLYSQLINGEEQHLIYKPNTYFDFQLLSAKHKILIHKRDEIILLNEDGSNYENIFTAPKGKWIGSDSHVLSDNQNLMYIGLRDDDYHIDPQYFILDIERKSIQATGEKNVFDSNNLGPVSKNGFVALISQGSLIVNGDEIITWPNYDYKFNSGCRDPQWLPIDDILTVTCNGSIRIIDLKSNKNAELTKGPSRSNGGVLQWF